MQIDALCMKRLAQTFKNNQDRGEAAKKELVRQGDGEVGPLRSPDNEVICTFDREEGDDCFL